MIWKMYFCNETKQISSCLKCTLHAKTTLYEKKNVFVLCWESSFSTISITHILKQADAKFTAILIKNIFLMYIKLDYFYFSVFDLGVKLIEILKNIRLSS